MAATRSRSRVRAARWCLALLTTFAFNCGSRTGLETPDVSLHDVTDALRSDASDSPHAVVPDVLMADARLNDAVVPDSHPPSAEVAVGGDHICARLQDDTVWCWGQNAHGQLGDGTRADHARPQPVPGLTGVAQLALGDIGSCARMRDGTVRCWGDAAWGQHGNGDPTDMLVPTTVPGLNDVVELVSAWYTLCALKSDGTVWCWGNDTYRQLGRTANSEWCTTSAVASYCGRMPQRVQGLPDGIAHIATGRLHECALTSDGTAWCWGSLWLGPLAGVDSCAGPMNVPCTATPRRIALAGPVVQLAPASHFTCGRSTRGDVSCGQDTPPDDASLHAARTVFASEWHVFVELADRTLIREATTGGPAVAIPIPEPITMLSIYFDRPCMVGDSGSIWCASGLGDGMVFNRIAF